MHYLTHFWCLKPNVIDKDRTLNGDYYKKPTQYWFIGLQPKNNFIFEPLEAVDVMKQRYVTSDNSLGVDRKTARSMIGEDKILGVSAANIKEAKKAQRDSADYIGVGAVYPTNTKDDATSVPKKELKEIVKSVDIPVVAIGGITQENAHELNDCGIDGLSVVSAIMEAENPKIASKNLLKEFKAKNS